MVSWEGATEVGDAIKVISTRDSIFEGNAPRWIIVFPRFTEDLLNCYDCRANDRNSNCIPLEAPPWFVSFRSMSRMEKKFGTKFVSFLFPFVFLRGVEFLRKIQDDRSSGKRVDNPVVLSRVWSLFRCDLRDTFEAQIGKSERRMKTCHGPWNFARGVERGSSFFMQRAKHLHESINESSRRNRTSQLRRKRGGEGR